MCVRPRMAAVLILCGCFLAACSRSERVVQTDRYLVGAYYYLWYPANFERGFLRDKLSPPQMPVVGRYQSRDVGVIEQHIAWCSRYGIDFLAVNWWPTKSENIAAIEPILKARNIKDIKFCIFYETWHLNFQHHWAATMMDDETTKRFISEIERLADALFDHPSYLRVDDRPVVVLYLTRSLAGDFEGALSRLREALKAKGHDVFLIGDEVFWRVTPVVREGKPYPLVAEPQPDRIRCLDAITAYNMYESAWKIHQGYGSESRFVSNVAVIYDQYRRAMGPGTYFVPGIIPGFNDRGVRLKNNHYAVPRQWQPGAAEGSFLSETFDRTVAPFIDDRLNMILLTSFNEWNEDTAIEPLAAAPVTTHDVSESKESYTQGYAYSGYGTTYLEVIRDKVVAVAGRAVTSSGDPVRGKRVTAWRGKSLIAETITDWHGYYRLSRLPMPPGAYDVRLGSSKDHRSVHVVTNRTVTGVNWTMTKGEASR